MSDQDGSQGGSYLYDVFISYADQDLAWAQRLSASLLAKDMKAFVAPESIRAGTAWETQLVEALQGSKHLVVLWSEAARASDWVSDEMSRFREIIDPLRRGSTDRFLVQVLLEGESHRAFRGLQGVYDIKEAGAYPAGAEEVEPNLWAKMVSSVTDSLQAAAGSLPVPVLVVGMTADQLDAIDLDRKPADIPTFRDLLANLGITDKSALAPYYGATVRDWRPFGSTSTISTILGSERDAINAAVKGVKGRPFRWDYVDEDFWSSKPERITAAADRLAVGPAVIVVDALALYDDTVRSRFPNRLWRALDNQDALFLVPAPFPMPPGHVHLRSLVQLVAQQLIDYSYEPPVLSGAAYARCGATITDERDIQAWVLTAIGPQLRQSRLPAGGAFLSHGAPG